MGFKRTEECSDEYLAQRDAADDVAGAVPDRCLLCRAEVSMCALRRCRECGGPCCERCHLSVDGRVECYGCMCLDSDDAARLMPLSAREWQAPGAADYARLDALAAAYLAEPVEAEADLDAETRPSCAVAATAESESEGDCRECGEPAEPGWGGYCCACGAEWSTGPGKLVVA